MFDQRQYQPAWKIVRAVAEDRRFRYLVAGGVAAVVYYAIFALLWLLLPLRVHYDAVAVLANAVTVVATYPLYRRYVFNAHVPWVSGFPRFYLTCLFGLAVTLVGLPLLVEVAHVPVLIAQAALIIAGPVINYQIHRMWTFRHRGMV